MRSIPFLKTGTLRGVRSGLCRKDGGDHFANYEELGDLSKDISQGDDYTSNSLLIEKL